MTCFHNDHLGSPIATSDPYGDKLWTENYKPYGEKLDNVYAVQTEGYTGHQFDAQTGLTYMQARYYDPVVGRFYSNDPVGALGHLNSGNIHGFNRYAYANNNPYKYTDPNGESPTIAAGAGAGCAATGPACPAGAVVGGLIGAIIGVAIADAAINHFNESAENGSGSDTDTEVSGLTEGLSPEKDSRGRDKKGQFVNPEGSAEEALDSLSGETGENDQKTLTDGSVAGVHTFSGKSGGKQGENTGSKTLHIKSPPRKARYQN